MITEDYATEAKILIVDDEQYVLSYLATVLASEEYSITTSPSGAEALRMVQEDDFDVVLSDLMMPDVNGLKLLEEIRRSKAGTAVILITAYGSLRSAITAMRLGAVDYVLKPCDEEELRLRVHNACERQIIKKEYEMRTRELESVIFAISHDLSGHLVALRGFARRLRSACADQLTRDGHEYMDRIESSADLMEKMIKSIGDFARAGRGTGKIEKIGVRKLVQDVLQNLQSSIEERNVDVRVADELPEIEGEWLRIYQIFHNIINNAIKFSREDVRPVVEIGVDDAGKYHRFSVKDNGVGIRKDEQEKIFEMFCRTDRTKVPGTGMGLAIARKIVTSVGGSIWVESEENQGSTFYFTIPKAPCSQEKPEQEARAFAE